MKVMLPEQTGTPEMIERFRREIRMLASLNHPNIAALHNAFYFENQLIMIMELIEGEDLRSISSRSLLPIPLLLEAASQVLAALEYAHARGVIHRDIKPANIMVTPQGVVKILDFGIAIAERSAELTAAGSLIGSPTHMPPEQIRGGKATPQSDIYALGVTLYELIAGRLPFSGSNTYELMMAHLHQVPAPLNALRADTPPYLAAAVAKALEKDPARRFATAADFLATLHPHDTPAPTSPTYPVAAPPLDPTAILPTPASIQKPPTGDLARPITASSSLPLEPIIHHLATFIGPIAKTVVNRLAKQHTDLDRLYTEAARQIDSEPDRQRFLRTRPH